MPHRPASRIALCLPLGLALCLALMGGMAAAQALCWSGFGTLGFAPSDRDFSDRRHITDRGGFGRDTPARQAGLHRAHARF